MPEISGSMVMIDEVPKPVTEYMHWIFEGTGYRRIWSASPPDPDNLSAWEQLNGMTDVWSLFSHAEVGSGRPRWSMITMTLPNPSQTLFLKFLIWVWPYTRSWNFTLSGVEDLNGKPFKSTRHDLGFYWAIQDIRVRTPIDALKEAVGD